MTTPERPTIVCISGSTRFESEIMEAAREESVEGRMVLLPICNLKTPHRLWPTPEHVQHVMATMAELHFHQIDTADEMLVVAPALDWCPDGYIGESTKAEIAYAEQHGKPIRYRHICTSTATVGPHTSAECELEVLRKEIRRLNARIDELRHPGNPAPGALAGGSAGSAGRTSTATTRTSAAATTRRPPATSPTP